MRKLLLIILFLFFAAFLAVVFMNGSQLELPFKSNKSSAASNTSPTATATRPVISAPLIDVPPITDKNILLKITTEKDTYAPGEIIYITGSVENLSSKSIEYVLGNIGDPVPYFSINTNSYFRGFSLYDENGPPMVLTMQTTGQLNPHSKIERTVIWNQKYSRYQPAPQGTYKFTCGITLGNWTDSSKQKHFSVSREINVVGVSTSIGPEDAKKIALNIPEVKAWVEAHSGTEAWPLDTYVELYEGNWVIMAGNYYGPSPRYARIRIDQVTGAVVEKTLTDDNRSFIIHVSNK
jgi:hypothetical protein